MKAFHFLSIAILFFSLSAHALSPQQYCEKLHARVVAAGGSSSDELLNVEYPAATMVNFSTPGAATFICNNGSQFAVASSCSSAGGLAAVMQNDIANVYSSNLAIKKCCKNGNFLYSSVTTVNIIQGCGGGAGCPVPGSICAGTACDGSGRNSTCP